MFIFSVMKVPSHQVSNLKDALYTTFYKILMVDKKLYTFKTQIEENKTSLISSKYFISEKF